MTHAVQSGTGNAYGLWVKTSSAEGGAAYGVYVEPVGAINYFAGDVGIGATPTKHLFIKGAATRTDAEIALLPNSSVRQYSIGSIASGSIFRVRDDSAGTVKFSIGPSITKVEAGDFEVVSGNVTLANQLTVSGQSTFVQAATFQDSIDVGQTSDSFNSVQILSTTTGQGVLEFNDGGGSGAVIYSHTTDLMELKAGGVVGLSINSASTTVSGEVNLGNDNIQRTVDTGALTISGGSDSGIGANITLFGSSHATLGRDIRFRVNAVNVYYYDYSASSHTFTGTLESGDHTISGTDLVFSNAGLGVVRRSTGTLQLSLTGGSSTSVGANITLYGQTHATLANDILFRANTTEVYRYDHSATSHSFAGALKITASAPSSGFSNIIGGFTGSNGAARLLVTNFTAGASSDRVGLLFENQGVGNERLWMDDSGILRTDDADPTSESSGYKYFREGVSGTWNLTGTLGVSGDVSTTNGGAFFLRTGASTTPALRTYLSGHTADISSWSAFAGLEFASYQTDAGPPYTKTSSIIANGDGTVPSELLFWTKTNGNASPTVALTIDSSQNATFAGDVTVNGTNINLTSANPALNFTDTSSGGDAFSIFANSGNFYVYNVTDAAIHVTYDGSLGTTFAGNLTVGSGKITSTSSTLGEVFIQRAAATTGEVARVSFGYADATKGYISLHRDGGANNGTMYFAPTASGGTATERMSLDGSGNLILSAGDLEVSAGNVLLGASATSSNAQLYIFKSRSNSTGTEIGAYAYQRQSVATTGTLLSLDGVAESTHTTGTVAKLIGVQGLGQAASIGNVTAIYGGYFKARNLNATAVVATGVGLYIDANDKTGAITSSWGLYQNGSADSNYFAGDVRIGTTRASSHGQESLRIVNTGNRGIALDRSDSDASFIHFTNSTTGDNTTQGMVYGIDSSESGYIWNYQTTPIKFAPANTERLRIASDAFSISFGFPTPRSPGGRFASLHFVLGEIFAF